MLTQTTGMALDERHGEHLSGFFFGGHVVADAAQRFCLGGFAGAVSVMKNMGKELSGFAVRVFYGHKAQDAA